MRRTIATILATIALALLTAGCGAQTDGPEVTDPGDDPDAAETVAGDPASDASRLTERCESPRDGYAISYPDDWHTDRGEGVTPCRAFDPEPLDLEPNTDIPLDTAVIVSATAVGSLDEVADEDIGATHHERERTEVAGHDAVVVDATGTGAGMIPEGVEFRSYFVDLDHGIVVASSFDVGDPDLETKHAVLDDMVETIEPIEPERDTRDDPADDDATAGPDAPDGDTATVEAEPTGDGIALLRDLRIGAHDGFDRVVLEFEGDTVPGYVVTYEEPPFHEDPSGHEVEVDGTSFLDVHLDPASGRDADQQAVYEGPDRVTGAAGAVTEVVLLSDHHGGIQWAVGRDGDPAPFRVDVLDDPARIVIDVAH